MTWLGGVPVYVESKQVAEVLRDKTFGFTVRNLRANGNVGVCYTNADIGNVRDWLDQNYPGWTKCAKS